MDVVELRPLPQQPLEKPAPKPIRKSEIELGRDRSKRNAQTEDTQGADSPENADPNQTTIVFRRWCCRRRHAHGRVSSRSGRHIRGHNHFRRAGQLLGDLAQELRHPEIHPVLEEGHQAVDEREMFAVGQHLPAHLEDHPPAHVAQFDLFFLLHPWGPALDSAPTRWLA